MNKLTHPRLRRERRTVHKMIRLFCQHHHRSDETCDCRQLARLADNRLTLCRFGADKPTCSRCPQPCYPAAKRARIRQIMAWAGPRMAWRHPWLTLRHWLDGQRRSPIRPNTRPLPR